MGVFTTQTLLSSVGVSRNRVTPGAVAINWILKVLPIPFKTLMRQFRIGKAISDQ